LICYDDLIYLASLFGIKVVNRDIHSEKPLLDGYAKPNEKLIVLEKSLEYTTHGLCVLAEEIGHCLFPPLSNHIMYHKTNYHDMSYWNRDNLAVQVAKEETQAIEFATTLLIPDQEFWKHYSTGPHEIWEWCEHFGVAEWFMRRKIGFMRSKKHFKWRDIVKRITVAGGFGV
jgi:Zn-dependent peptidase ImmA (M78 family)